MLGWLGQREDSSRPADETKILEAPETPAPVFAIRAFKSALFGTPAAGDDEDDHKSAQKKPASRVTKPRDIPKKPALETSLPAEPDDHKLKLKQDSSAQQVGSPTKSILVTPGTAAARRKTVSFGDGVVDNERKKGALESKTSKRRSTPGKVTSQWILKQPEKTSKSHSRFTQSLLDAREKKDQEEDVFGESTNPEMMSNTDRKLQWPQDGNDTGSDTNDDTINLQEPRSQSGQFWKNEFECYRAKTSQEMMKLIQYRSVAKSYARKKDAEAARLADKLKGEEAKVAEMEQHVSELAAGMVTSSGDENVNREQLVRDLTKQTALALQYKHKVNTLRKMLQRHGVLDNEPEQNDEVVPAMEESAKFHKTEQALEQANARINDMMSQKANMKELEDLVDISEKKVRDLESENRSLKQSLARVKEEMSKYEARRQAKETKLKQREQKLETRNQQLRERLKQASLERRESEEALKSSFSDEKKRMQKEIDALLGNITVADPPRLPVVEKRSPEKLKLRGFETKESGMDDYSQRESRRASNVLRRSNTRGGIDMMDLDVHENPLPQFREVSPVRKRTSRSQADLPPSSPPVILSSGNGLLSPEKFHLKSQHTTFTSPRPSMVMIQNELVPPYPSQSSHLQHNSRSKHSGQPDHRSGNSRNYGNVDEIAKRKAALPTERLAAAQARLKHRQEGARKKGKENIFAF